MTEIEQLRADNARLLELLAGCHDIMRESSNRISELTASLVSKCVDNRANAKHNAILRFKLPEEQGEFRDAIDGCRLRSLLLEFDQYLKDSADYAEDSEREAAAKHRDHLCALLREYNLEI